MVLQWLWYRNIFYLLCYIYIIVHHSWKQKKRKNYFFILPPFKILFVCFIFSISFISTRLSSLCLNSHLFVSPLSVHPKLNVTGPHCWPTPSNQAADLRYKPISPTPPTHSAQVSSRPKPQAPSLKLTHANPSCLLFYLTHLGLSSFLSNPLSLKLACWSGELSLSSSSCNAWDFWFG